MSLFPLAQPLTEEEVQKLADETVRQVLLRDREEATADPHSEGYPILIMTGLEEGPDIATLKSADERPWSRPTVVSDVVSRLSDQAVIAEVTLQYLFHPCTTPCTLLGQRKFREPHGEVVQDLRRRRPGRDS